MMSICGDCNNNKKESHVAHLSFSARNNEALGEETLASTSSRSGFSHLSLVPKCKMAEGTQFTSKSRLSAGNIIFGGVVTIKT